MYKCKKCKGSKMRMVIKGPNTGLYCETCGAWQKWLSKEEVLTAKFNKIEIFKNVEPKKINNEITEDVKDLFPNISKISPFDEVDSKKILNGNVEQGNKSPLSKNVKVKKDTVTIELPLDSAKLLLGIMKELESQIKNCERLE